MLVTRTQVNRGGLLRFAEKWRIGNAIRLFNFFVKFFLGDTSMRVRGILVLVAAAMGLFIAVRSTSHAALIAYEGFNYADATALNGLAGGTGWSDAWTAVPGTGGAAVAQSPGAAYPLLITEGNKAFIQRTNQAFRPLTAGILGTGATADETIWVSFIGQRTGANNVRLFRVGFYEASTANDPKFLVGEGNNDAADIWNMRFTGADLTGANPITSAVPITTQSLLLMKIDYNSAGADDMTMWINPDLSLGEPTNVSPSFVGSSIGEFDLAFSVVSMRAGTLSGGNEGQGFYDEIRIGTTFADVTPIPEPGSMILALFGLSSVFAVARRKRK
jgi:hypothetical protein